MDHALRNDSKTKGSIGAFRLRHADIKTTLKYYVTIRDEDMSEAADITARTLLADPK